MKSSRRITFLGLSGKVDETGQAVVTIPLEQVETKFDIRNERMREMFFETANFPTATIRTSVDLEKFTNLEIGERAKTEISGALSLHGVEADIVTQAFVTRIGENRVEVASVEPIIISVADFNLDVGLEALREVAGLPSITGASPVTFSFVFDREAR